MAVNYHKQRSRVLQEIRLTQDKNPFMWSNVLSKPLNAKILEESESKSWNGSLDFWNVYHLPQFYLWNTSDKEDRRNFNWLLSVLKLLWLINHLVYK